MFSLNNHKSREILENGNHGFMFLDVYYLKCNFNSKISIKIIILLLNCHD